MGAKTNISWCDCTFNPVLGCTKVSPACDGCYAEHMMDTRFGRVQWGGPGKGAGTRVRTSVSNWNLPLRWERDAIEAGTRPFVFCASLADVFDNAWDPQWRRDLFGLIHATPRLVWLLLTKRPQNIVKMASQSTANWPSNAAIGTTVEDQIRADINIPHLGHAAAVLQPIFSFLSCEPLLGPIVIPRSYLVEPDGIGWIIAGGETDQGEHVARPPRPEWFRSLRDQAAAAGKPFHMKQWGEFGRPETDEDVARIARGEGYGAGLSANGRFEDMHKTAVLRVGKNRSGRLLDGVLHDARPQVA